MGRTAVCPERLAFAVGIRFLVDLTRVLRYSRRPLALNERVDNPHERRATEDRADNRMAVDDEHATNDYRSQSNYEREGLANQPLSALARSFPRPEQKLKFSYRDIAIQRI